jgi:hypothetical protein
MTMARRVTPMVFIARHTLPTFLLLLGLTSTTRMIAPVLILRGIVADRLNMKKGTLIVVLAWTCMTAAALDWKLPVVTLKYDVTGGSIESPDPDEDILIPSSLRNTVSLRIKESARPLDLGLTVRWSAKDYFEQSGDYSYLSLEQDARLDLGGGVDLGYVLGARLLTSPQTDGDGLSKDMLALTAGLDAQAAVVRGTRADLSLDARAELAEAGVKSRQVYRASTGLTSRIGQWLLGMRYRAEARLPASSPTLIAPSFLNVGSVSLQWDPNR